MAMMIETLEQLEALPVGAVVGGRDVDGRVSVATKDDDTAWPWSVTGLEGRFSSEALERFMNFPLNRYVPSAVTDEMVELASEVLADVTGNPRPGRFETTMARVALEAGLGGAS